MDRASLAFCLGSLGLALLIAIVAFPYAAMDGSIIATYEKPQPAYELGSVDVGKGFGKVSVEELMAYYIENPPVQKLGVIAAPKIRFGGC